MAETITGMASLNARLTRVGSVGLKRTLELLALSTTREAKLLVPRQTGNLGRSITITGYTTTSATVTARANYAAYVEYGTRAHIIKPRNAKVLAWGGARRLSGSLRSGAKPTAFAMVVHHPGTRPHPYLIPGAKIAVEKSGVAAIVDAWNGVTP